MFNPNQQMISERFNTVLSVEINNMLHESRDLKIHKKVKMHVVYKDLTVRAFEFKEETITSSSIYVWANKILEKETLVTGVIIKYPSVCELVDSEGAPFDSEVINYVSVSKNRTFIERKAFSIQNGSVTDKYIQSFYDEEIDLFESLVNTEGNC